MKKISTVGLYSLMSLALVFGLVAMPAKAADHLDAPGLTPPGGDTRLDITDIYAFQSPSNSANTVLILNVNPLAGVLNDGTFRPGASYEIKVQRNQADDEGETEVETLTYKLSFGAADASLNQSVTLRLSDGDGRHVLAKGMTGQNISIPGGGMLRAGVFDDPFFFDLNAFLSVNFCAPGANFFNGLNVSSIVLEVPSSWLGSNNVGVWARTVLKGKQIDRMGRPAINTVFIPNNPFEPNGSEPSQKNAFNAGKPKNDQRDFRGEVVDTLQIFYGTNDPTVDALADFLLPDILTVDTSSAAGFPNGRGLADDVIDIELGLVTNGAVTTDCVANDSAFTNTFPYLAPAN
ncbi:MAG: DUF4331 family protein [Chloroflexi bacterium]|nr:DUF4331 family protein [Chloroflexota bacterium]